MELSGKRLLVVDDEPLFLQTTSKLLENEGAACQTAVDAASAVTQLEHNEFDLILTDLNMPGNLRWELLQAGRQRFNHIPMIVITGVPTLPSAIESLRLGVTDYLLKPIAFPELLSSITRTLRAAEQSSTVANLKPALTLIGESPAMQEIVSMIDRIAQSSAHVMITGATGTGKELIARVIHERSRQVSGDFVIFDCNTVIEDQLALDLFGSVDPMGQVSKSGLLQQANGGCLFLDEVAELPLNIQPKLLRVVQNQEFTPVGGTKPQSIDVRFISSSQRKLSDEIAAGRFRNDLYYRLGILSLHVPPLHSRGNDILLLAEYFLRESNYSELSISQSVRKALLEYSWPGNVRQLRNVIVQAATFCNGKSIELSDLPEEMTEVPSVFQSGFSAGGKREDADSSLQETRMETERVYLLKLLEDSRGNVTHAAQKANMSRQGFHKLLKRHQISAADYR